MRAHELRFMIFVDDHQPAHVHVFGDGEAKVEIGRDTEPPRLIYSEQMSSSVQRRIVRIVRENRRLLLQKWTEIHDGVD